MKLLDCGPEYEPTAPITHAAPGGAVAEPGVVAELATDLTVLGEADFPDEPHPADTTTSAEHTATVPNRALGLIDPSPTSNRQAPTALASGSLNLT